MGPTAARRWLVTLGALAVLAAGFLVWSPGLNGPYQFDDYATPLDDPASQSLAAWSHYLPLTLRPLTKLSYALEADAGLTSRPGVRRAFSIGLLAVAALLLYGLIAQLQPGLAPLAAAFLAALWFLHPVHADSVLMLSGRTALRALAPVLVAGLMVVWWFVTTPRYVALAEYSFLGRPLWDSLAAQVGAVPAGLALLLQPSRLSIDYGIPLPTARECRSAPSCRWPGTCATIPLAGIKH
jgi:hypothetical protein